MRMLPLFYNPLTRGRCESFVSCKVAAQSGRRERWQRTFQGSTSFDWSCPSLGVLERPFRAKTNPSNLHPERCLLVYSALLKTNTSQHDPPRDMRLLSAPLLLPFLRPRKPARRA